MGKCPYFFPNIVGYIIMKPYKIILVFMIIVFTVSCTKKDKGIDISMINDQQELLKIISDKNTNYDNFVMAIQKLDANQPPSFWSNIANDKSYSEKRRRVAIVELFQRYVSPGMTLCQLGTILNNPTWIKNDDVYLITIYTGRRLLKQFSPGSVFFFFLFRDITFHGMAWSLAVRVEGEIGKEDFLKAIKGQEVDQKIKDAKILELGMHHLEYKNGYWPSDLYDR